MTSPIALIARPNQMMRRAAFGTGGYLREAMTGLIGKVCPRSQAFFLIND
jgi:hypothetical protein